MLFYRNNTLHFQKNASPTKYCRCYLYNVHLMILQSLRYVINEVIRCVSCHVISHDISSSPVHVNPISSSQSRYQLWEYCGLVRDWIWLTKVWSESAIPSSNVTTLDPYHTLLWSWRWYTVRITNSMARLCWVRSFR